MSNALMTQTTRPQSPRFQAKRDAILDAAASLFNQMGVKGATLSDIAARVGLITTSVTYYYRRKEQLATACIHRTIEALAETTRAAAEAPGLDARIHAFFRGHAARLADTARGTTPALVQLNDLRALPDPYFQEVSTAYTTLFRQVRALISAPDAPVVPRANLNARAHYVLSISHWMRTWTHDFDADEYERMADRVSDIVLHGIAAPGTSWQDADDAAPHWALVDEPQATAEAFLRAASELVNEQGYRGASVDKISARLNVTKGAFYHHNDNKEDVVLRCFERTFHVIRRAIEASRTDGGNGWERTSAIVRALVAFQLSPAGPLLRMGATTVLSDLSQRLDVMADMRRVTQRIAGDIVDGMIDGSVRPLDPLLAAQVATATINNASELRDWVSQASSENVPRLFVRPMLLGLRSAA
ncbi:TetR/AcrR family transcriptional regulator [Verticiella alkaliphila]|uniref:TetR/AcrR family transcriptional regulator n=1 Tax=Verticiella alkaliphila TaxID=2779529 RepID=UPI00353023CA